MTPETLPLGEDMPPMAVPISVAEAGAYADEYARDPDPRWRGPNARLHTGWISGRPTRLLRHTYHYNAGIHASSQIQQLAPAYAGQTVTVAGHISSAYQRKGHEYCLQRRRNVQRERRAANPNPSGQHLPGREALIRGIR